MNGEIIIENGCRVEFVASQLSKLMGDKILGIKDGYIFLIYDSDLSIPKDLTYLKKRSNKLINTTEYYYYQPSTKENYIFFKPIHRIVAKVTSVIESQSNFTGLTEGDVINIETENVAIEEIERRIIL